MASAIGELVFSSFLMMETWLTKLNMSDEANYIYLFVRQTKQDISHLISLIKP